MSDLQPIPNEQFDKAVFYRGDAKARSRDLEERASLTDVEARHIACFDVAFAREALIGRDKALKALDRQRLEIQARARVTTAAPPRARDEGPREAESWDAFVKRNPTYRVSVCMLDPLVQFVHEINGKNKERNARLDALEQRVKELEQQPATKGGGITFRGAWGPDEAYAPNDLAVHSGSCWIATSPVSGVAPSTTGHGAENWSLFASRGRTGRSGERT